MVSVKEAVLSATQFARDTLDPQQIEGLRLEEVETSGIGENGSWLITLSMVSKEKGLSVGFRVLRD